MPINPIIDTSNSPRLNETFLTLDQRRKLSQKLQNISPDLTRFNVAGESYDPSKIRVNVEICYGKFDTLNQTFEYEEDRGGSGEIRMETYIGSVPRGGFYYCKQEISNLLSLLKIVEENLYAEANKAENLRLFNTVNEILKLFVVGYDNQMREKYENRFSKKFYFTASMLALVSCIIGLPLLMYGYNQNTGFIGPAYFTTTGTVLSVSTSDDYNNDNHQKVQHQETIEFAYNGCYNGTTPNGQSLYIGGTICNTFMATHAPYSFSPGQTHKIAVLRTNKYNCDTVEDLEANFITGVVFLTLCGFLIIVMWAHFNVARNMKEPEYIL